MFKTLGRLRYSPQLLGNSPSKWWLILDCDFDGEIGRYYRHLHWLASHRCCELQRPSWLSHVTVIRDEQPPNTWLWGLYNGREVEIEYEPIVCDDGSYFWVNVSCPVLLDVREELGLARKPLYPLHLSIGHLST